MSNRQTDAMCGRTAHARTSVIKCASLWGSGGGIAHKMRLLLWWHVRLGQPAPRCTLSSGGFERCGKKCAQICVRPALVKFCDHAVKCKRWLETEVGTSNYCNVPFSLLYWDLNRMTQHTHNTSINTNTHSHTIRRMDKVIIITY